MEPIEEWKDTDFIEVSVSSHGRVMALAGRMAGRVRRGTTDERGYTCYSFRLGGPKGKVKKVPIHRLVALAFLGKPPSPQHQVNHKDGCKTNNRVENLEWVTPQENIKHSVRTGLWKPAFGESHKSSRLSTSDVEAIKRECIESGDSQKVIAKRWGITQGHVSDIRNGKKRAKG